MTPGDNTSPPAPDLDAAVPGDDRVDLTWTVASPPADLFGFVVSRLDPNAAVWTEVSGILQASQEVFAFSDLTVDNDAGTYGYKVESVDTAGLRAASEVENADPLDDTPPDVPQNLFALPQPASLDLFWQPSGAEDVLDYQVARNTSPMNPLDPNLAVVSDPIDPNSPTYVDDEVSPNTSTGQQAEVLRYILSSPM